MLDFEKVEIWTGNHAIANAAKLCRPKVIAAYPITPSTEIIEAISSAIETGELDADFIPVESEHAAMAGVMGASAAGARTFTATSSQGLLYMAEMIYWVGYGRLPVVIGLVNRALAPGWSIWVDHQDAYSMRDAGWLQVFAKNNQEAYDLTIQAYKIAENHDVYMPMAINLDGFVLSHVAGQVEQVSQEFVDNFLPAFEPLFKLDPKDPISFGALTLPGDYMKLRLDLQESAIRAKTVMRNVFKEWTEKTGRDWGGLIEYYGPETADIAIIAMGTMAEEAEEAVDLMNLNGMNVGVMRIRSFRPFPDEEFVGISKKYGKLLVLDRGFSFGSDPPLAVEVRNALYKAKETVPIVSKIFGFGGADVTFNQIADLTEKVLKEE
jgi:pyruvate ferredoxin oxidoreductase alpha subunit